MEEDLIKRWISRVLKESTWEKYDDLHITEIDPGLKKRKEEWLVSGIRLLKRSSRMLDEFSEADAFLCVLAFSIKPTRQKIKRVPAHLSTLQAKISHTPPSLYLMKNDWSDWMETLNTSTEVFIDDLKGNYKSMFHQMKDENDGLSYASFYIFLSGRKLTV